MATNKGMPRFDFELLEDVIEHDGHAYYVVLSHSLEAGAWVTDRLPSSIFVDGFVVQRDHYPMVIEQLRKRGLTIWEPGIGLPPIYP